MQLANYLSNISHQDHHRKPTHGKMKEEPLVVHIVATIAAFVLMILVAAVMILGPGCYTSTTACCVKCFTALRKGVATFLGRVWETLSFYWDIVGMIVSTVSDFWPKCSPDQFAYIVLGVQTCMEESAWRRGHCVKLGFGIQDC